MPTGGCYCGQVRYEAAGPVSHQTICHCSICRKTTGAPFVAWFSVPQSTFRFVRGDPARFKSTAKGTRRFCPSCATQLTFEHVDLPDEIDITTCSLDEPGVSTRGIFAPQDHTWTSSRLPWIDLGDDLPAHAELRGSVDEERMNLAAPVLEVATLTVLPAQCTQFEAVFREAASIISSMPGYRSHELRRCVETSNRYILLVQWRALEDHTVGFRSSPEYQRWRGMLHHFYDPFPTVEHYGPPR